MGKKTSLITSSVGQKLLMALSGFFLCSFLLLHLTINMFLFARDGGETFDTYAEFMATYPLIRPLEIVLFAGFLLHAFVGTVLWVANRRARPVRYAVTKPGETSTLASRVAFLTGAFVFVFLVVHVNTFFVTSRFFPTGATMFHMVRDAFRNPWYDAFYIAALGFLGYHLKHGFASAFQTLGLRNTRYENLIDAVSVIFWLLIPICFAAIPLYFLWLS
jgi:succinate dehydrogenase (or fumarate reductase) cytochrome b subunit, b558 family